MRCIPLARGRDARRRAHPVLAVLAAVALAFWVGPLDLRAQSAVAARGFQSVGRPERTPEVHTLYQVSTLDALSKGVYQGVVPVGQLRRYGDFGLGTVDGLDGEVVILDGVFYQVTSDGIVHLLGDEVLVPFGALTPFSADLTSQVESSAGQPVALPELVARISAMVPSPNYFYAVKVDGLFRSVLARSVPKQMEPYPPLAEVIPLQSTFPLTEVEGTAVCLVTPAYAAGINAEGLHCHFISRDRRRGGHALELEIRSATLSIGILRQHTTYLPDDEAFREIPLPAGP